MISFFEKYFLQISFVCALFLYSIAAINSHGFYQADEHYQIVEFANYKLGNIDSEELAWEYKNEVRSGFQPLMAFTIIKCCQILNMDDPFQQMTVFRLLAMLFSLSSIFYLISYFIDFLNHKRAKYSLVLFSIFLWFLPLLYVRFSSENSSTSFFIFGLILLLKKIKHSSFGSILAGGILLGLSFILRYQMAILIGAFVVWLLIIRKEKLKHIGILILGSFIAFFIGVLADYWLYNDFTITSINYLIAAVKAESPIAFEHHVWYQYIAFILFKPFLANGLLIFISFTSLLLLKWKNLVLWLVLPFVLFHSLFPHKEIRFLFPLIPFIALGISQSYDLLLEKISRKSFRNFLSFTIAISLVFNLIIFIQVIDKSAPSGIFGAVNYLKKNENSKEVNLYHGSIYGIGYPSFYRQGRNFKSIQRFEDTLKINPSETNYLIVKKEELLNGKLLNEIIENKVELVYSSYPKKFQNPFTQRIFNEGNVFYLYRLNANLSALQSDTISYCGAEQVNQEKNKFENSRILFSGIQQQTTKQYYSGHFSLITTNEIAFGFDHKLPNLKNGALLRISVMRKGVPETSIVISAENPEVYYLSSSRVVEKMENGWEKIQTYALIPSQIKGLNLKAYVWNYSKDTCYFDDFCIEIIDYDIE